MISSEKRSEGSQTNESLPTRVELSGCDIRERNFGQVVGEKSKLAESAQLLDYNQTRVSSRSPSPSPSSSPIGSLHKLTTTTSSSSSSATSDLPIRSKAAVEANFTALQTPQPPPNNDINNRRAAYTWNQNSTHEEPELLPEEPVEASLGDVGQQQEEREDSGEPDNGLSVEGEVQDEGAEVVVAVKRDQADQFERKLWLDCRVAADALTSLSAHVDEAKRELNDILGSQTNQQVTTSTIAPDEKVVQTSARENLLHLLHRLMQKRNELRHVDKQLFNIMTQYLTQLDMSAANLPEAFWSEIGRPAHQQQQFSGPLQHLQFEPTWMSQHEYLATCEFYRQLAMQNYQHVSHNYETGANAAVAMDLSSPVHKTTSLSSSSSSLTNGWLSGSSNSLDALSTGNCSSEVQSAGSSGAAAGSVNPFDESFKAVKKTSSVNLKKSRLLADLNIGNNSNNINGPTTIRQAPTADGQTSRLNLLKRYCSPPRSENSTKSTSSTSSSQAISSGLDATVTLQQQHQPRRHSLTRGCLDGYLFAAPDVILGGSTQPQHHDDESAASSWLDSALLNPQHKKFRPLSQETHQELHQKAAIYTIPVVTSNLKPDHRGFDAHFNAAALQLAQHHHKQQQLLLSEMMLIDQQHQQQLRLSQAAASQPASLSLMTTAAPADSPRNPIVETTLLNSFKQQQALFEPRSATNNLSNVNNHEIKCCNPRSVPFSTERAYVLAMQHGDGGSSRQDPSPPSIGNGYTSDNLPRPSQVLSQSEASGGESNLQTVALTPAKLTQKDALELVRASIGKDHQLMPVRQEAQLMSQHESLRPKMAYRCHVCGSGFEDRHRLQQHLSIHLNLHPSWFEERTIKETMAQYESKRGDYLCSICNLRHETTAEFDKHMQLHGDKPHRCDLCDQDNKLVCFRYYRQLLTHLRSHCFLYSCRFAPDCKQTSNRKDYLKLHILKHHLNNKLPEQYTICCH